MPRSIRQALESLQKLNQQQKSKILTAEEIILHENNNQSVANESPSKLSQTFYDASSTKQKNLHTQSNKYNRNVLLVLQSALTGAYSNLFTQKEQEICEKFASLSFLAQTLFARMLTRKRLWFNVREHLHQYVSDRGSTSKQDDRSSMENVANLKELLDAVNELIQSGLMVSESSITDNLLLEIESNLNIPSNKQKIKLEPLAQILNDLTVPQLTALGKLATKSIRKVSLAEVDCIDVENNPFYSLS